MIQKSCVHNINDNYNDWQSHGPLTMLFFQDISRVISNWYATRSSNNTTIYMDLGESSTSFWIYCLEFYFPRHSVASPFFPLLSPFLYLSFALFLFFLFSPYGSPSRFHPTDRSAGHQRGFIPHSGTGVISHGWIGNPLLLLAPPRTYLPPPWL